MRDVMRMSIRRSFSKRSKGVLTGSKYVFFNHQRPKLNKSPVSGNFCSLFTNLCLINKSLLLARRTDCPPLIRHTLRGQYISSTIYVDDGRERRTRVYLIITYPNPANLVNKFRTQFLAALLHNPPLKMYHKVNIYMLTPHLNKLRRDLAPKVKVSLFPHENYVQVILLTKPQLDEFVRLELERLSVEEKMVPRLIFMSSFLQEENAKLVLDAAKQGLPSNRHFYWNLWIMCEHASAQSHQKVQCLLKLQ